MGEEAPKLPMANQFDWRIVGHTINGYEVCGRPCLPSSTNEINATIEISDSGAQEFLRSGTAHPPAAMRARIGTCVPSSLCHANGSHFTQSAGLFQPGMVLRTKKFGRPEGMPPTITQS